MLGCESRITKLEDCLLRKNLQLSFVIDSQNFSFCKFLPYTETTENENYCTAFEGMNICDTMRSRYMAYRYMDDINNIYELKLVNLEIWKSENLRC